MRAKGPAVCAGSQQGYALADHADTAGEREWRAAGMWRDTRDTGRLQRRRRRRSGQWWRERHGGQQPDQRPGGLSCDFASNARSINEMNVSRNSKGADVFALNDGVLHCEEASLEAIAQEHGTPTYVYSKRAILGAYARFVESLAGHRGLVCYAMKANSNLGVLDLLARAGSGFDIVSGGELARALAVGADPARIVFSGVGKTDAEIRTALAAGIACFNVESASELDVIDRLAREMGARAPVSLRINPDVDPKTHPYISTGLRSNKFGIDGALAEQLYARAAVLPGIRVVGIDCHIGSQVTSLEPYREAAERVFDLVDRLQARGIALEHVDFGGGFGIDYGEERGAQVPVIEEFVGTLIECAKQRGHADKKLVLEPGRSIVGNAGVLLTRVQYLKTGATRNFAIVDAAMNDLLRPALYDAWMDICPVVPRAGASTSYEIVGPVCESADWLGHDRALDLHAGDLLAIRSAGAYGMSMAGNYNSRARPAEVIVTGVDTHLVRRRESLGELFGAESTLP